MERDKNVNMDPLYPLSRQERERCAQLVEHIARESGKTAASEKFGALIGQIGQAFADEIRRSE